MENKKIENIMNQLGYSIDWQKGIIKNKENLKVGIVTSDNHEDLILEFTTKNRYQNNVNVYLKIGNSNQLVFMEEDGRVISFSIYDNFLQLIMPLKEKEGAEHIIIKGDKNSSLKNYLGTSYIYQLEYTFNNSKNANTYTTYQDYATLETPFNLKLITRNPDSSLITTEINDSPIRRIIEKDKTLAALTKRFQDYLKDTLVGLQVTSLLELLMAKELEANSVLSSPFRNIKISNIPDFSELKELGENIIFGIVYEIFEGRFYAHAFLVYDLKECYDLGYLDDTKRSCFEFNSQYIFKISKGKVESVFDYLNKIEVQDEADKKRLYKEFKGEKKFLKRFFKS